MKSPLLLIEDMPSLQMVYEAVLRKAGFQVTSAGTAAEGLAKFRANRPKVVLLDLKLPDRDGLDLMDDLIELAPDVRVIVITANGSINKAVQAMRGGAFEFLVKPFDENRLIQVIENAINLLRASEAKSKPIVRNGQFQGFIGASPEMQKIYCRICSISGSMATVFISGESGTGKEVAAQAVHDTSTRASGPFVPLNCGAIPADLLESEVFGHLKGSFTGAIADKIGAAGAADGGTLFLDEICEMDMSLQTKLLRFLQTSTIQPVGSVSARKVNVRIICATNRDPFEEVKKGRLREDLFYRLHVIPIELPALRARGEDVIQIAEHILKLFAAEEGRIFQRLDDDVKALFRRLPWPGNVRQLLNTLRNVVVLNDAECVTTTMLPLEILHLGEDATPPATAQPDMPETAPVGSDLGPLIGRPLAEIERIVIENTIAQNGGSISKAARVLDVSPSTLYRKLEAWR
ncbi:MAG: sigma-54-dependent Fis family transcriptional regulator [Alphaproteobacteria bacterium]|nr:sigma-54-dependent Fis family transcriptional regulator [Alphaproteobacteria bacterium]